MKQHAHTFAKSALTSFLVLAGLAFTPLSFLPISLALAVAFATTGWNEALLVYLVGVLIFIGLPFGGFLFAIIFSRSGERLRNIVSLAGIWIGSLTGSLAGVKMMGAS